MSFYMNMALNEGEQAEAYLKRKQNEYQRAKDADSKYKYDNNRNMDISKEWTQRRYEDPSMRAGREIKEYRKKYPNVVPKSKTRAEKLYDKKSDEIDNEYDYASKVYDNDRIENVRSGTDIGKIHDAARRHYRRHLAKNEAGIFSECNFIEFAY